MRSTTYLCQKLQSIGIIVCLGIMRLMEREKLEGNQEEWKFKSLKVFKFYKEKKNKRIKINTLLCSSSILNFSNNKKRSKFVAF